VACCYRLHLAVYSIVFRPGPVQGSGFDRVALVNFFFLKSKRRCFSKKKQKPTGCNQVFDQVLSGHTGFFLLLFFLQPGPILAPDRPGPGLTCRAGSGFKTMVYSLHVGRFRKHEMRSEQLPLRCLILLQIFLVEFNNARTLHKIKQRPK